MSVIGGSALNATDCLFANSTSLGDGGALLALAGSAISLTNCASESLSLSLPPHSFTGHTRALISPFHFAHLFDAAAAPVLL